MSKVNGLDGVVTAPGFTATAEILVQHGAISGIAVSADGAWLMATHYGDDSFSLIDAGNNAVAQTVVGIAEPFAIAVAATPQVRVYVSTVSAAYDSILAFDLTANRVVGVHVVGVHPVAHSVTDLAVGTDGRYVYVSRTAPNGADVAILDTATGSEDAIGIATAAGTSAGCVRVSPDGDRLYVAANRPSSAELVVIDTHSNRVLNAFEIGCPIRDIALSRDGATAYVASCGPDFGAVLDVFDTRTDTLAGTYKFGEIGGLLAQLVLSRDGERAYLVGETGVTVLSTSTRDVVGSIVVGAQPSCLTESPDGNRLYIADYVGAITVLTIAPRAACTDAMTADEVPTAPPQGVL
ncbi:YncE family protein [Candidatus Mycobacterium methanotrophicum]|uniref:YncE family protein n=1 Tax=Candidatus Mycobacterium methanotrophicum TaxID=2943498 RepID=A0ABY4QIT5_9MYCO|nr:YncE family protein [Candidatus Mycobacterium methanotrophicum]UQX10481.1 YncE family protein [Candidatus Mycobacterium methanotrophicum]